MKKLHLLLLAAAVALSVDAGNPDRFKERLSTLEKCEHMLHDPEADPVLRRAAFRKLLETAEFSEKTMRAGLSDRDPLIRSRSLLEYFLLHGDGAYPEMVKMAAEKKRQVANLLLECAKKIKSNDKSMKLIRLLAEKSGDQETRRQAKRLCSFTFYRKNIRLKDNPTYDHDIVTVKTIQLPQSGWKFKPDPMETGHQKGWFKPEFNDAKWKKLKIGIWEKQGYDGYDGIAWYRFRFTMPEKIDCNAVEIHFGAVDEAAWVWLNGKYIGQHDVGLAGWNKPFNLDITQEIQWGAENQLTVRVEDTAHAGGIWKPVSIEILK